MKRAAVARDACVRELAERGASSRTARTAD